MNMLFPNKSSCHKNQKKIISQESGNRHVVDNPHQIDVYQYHVDGDILPKDDTSGERCDYIVESSKQSKPIALIIELKGSDLLKAINQIEATIRRYKQQLANYEIYPRIVCHRITTIASKNTKLIKFRQKYPQTKYAARTLTDTI